MKIPVINQLLPKLRKGARARFLLMVVPNSATQKIRSWRVSFILALVIVSCILVTLGFLIGLATHIHTGNLQKINRQKSLIVKLKAENSRIRPLIAKSRSLEAGLTDLQKRYRQIAAAWNRFSQNGNIRLTPISRGASSRGGFFPERIVQPNNLPVFAPVLGRSKVRTISIKELDDKLRQLETVLAQDQREQDDLLQNLQVIEHHLEHTPSLWPLHTAIVSRFGVRFHPIRRKYLMHDGIDLTAAEGTKVKAAAAGTVCFSGWSAGYGYLLQIDHGNGYQTFYGHLSRFFVHTGQVIHKGQPIASSGNTGLSTGPHLHFEVRLNGNPVNPAPFLKE